MTKNKQGILALGFVAALCSVAAAQSPHWVGTWEGVPVSGGKMQKVKLAIDPSVSDTTFRNIVHVSLGGSTIRVRLSNLYGARPVTFAEVHVALSDKGSATKPGSDRAAKFEGAWSVTVPAGKEVWSDPVKLEVPPLTSLVVSVFVPKQPGVTVTAHTNAMSTNFLAEGDQAAAMQLTQPKPMHSWIFVTGVDVDAPPTAAAIAMIGGSLTDSSVSTIDANRRWPDDLARRLIAAKMPVGVLNAGIGGNQILQAGSGESMIVRMDRDVLAQSGIRWMVVYGGVNDIHRELHTAGSTPESDAAALIAGLQLMVKKAHAKGVKVFGATVTPMNGAPGSDVEATRQRVNEWVRTGGGFDAVLDFDKVVRDPHHPEKLQEKFDPTAGHTHLNDDGYQALADSIDLSKLN